MKIWSDPPLGVFKIKYSFEGFCKDIGAKMPRYIVHLLIDESRQWGYFDGAYKWNLGICGDGGILHLSSQHSIFFLVQLGLDPKMLLR